MTMTTTTTTTTTVKSNFTLVRNVDDCQKPFTHTAYRTAKTTITCDVPRKKDKAIVKFFCIESGSICEVVLSTRSSLRSNGTFTLTETNSGFNISITNVSSQHAGVYWCGVESNERRYRAALKKIQLQVEDITNSTRSLTTGQTFIYQCVYPNGAPIKKILCKGEDPSICEPLVNSIQRGKNTERFSIQDNKNEEITITMRQLTTEDSGTYWCGAQNTDKSKSNPFFHKLVMTVGECSHYLWFGAGGSWLSVIIPVVVCVALLMLILVFVYKRFQRIKNTRKAEAQNNKDPAYEEIQEHPQMPGSGTALKSIYVTANAPTNPSASQYYSTINFNSSSGEVSGDTYSTVRDNQQFPTYSTVNYPSILPEDSFYSTVNNPQQH
ncbi:polymeric immunoglobulin receptor-like isoform X3 [Epinephelus fuscoguttatus]|uniref:polymeric immunoglobulin receptor-like isoform X3 n=1 Tax=Epinephelus fuscoguttatus TaxID=293821 RepID=UPI0020D1CDB7|nr:polymeric immunoglobulin receptor-like isoform X3 [Epinephelus fuscoguttatus]